MRRSEFVEGTRIALADGQRWSFPPRPTGQDDPEYDGLLRTIFEAEDDPERLRGELALSILLLSRNYVLGPTDYQKLLGFRQGDPGLSRMQREVHQLILEQAEKLGLRGTRNRVSNPTLAEQVGRSSAPPLRRPGLRSVWSLWLN